jgi:hypothetical protein
MKRVFFKAAFLTAAVLFSGACESLPFNYYLSKSWAVPEGRAGSNKAGGAAAEIYLAAVSVDRTGGWASVEKEIRGLAPLLFLEQGCRLVSPGEKAVYTADIRVRERDYASGWRTKRSLAVEVRLWPAGDGNPEEQKDLVDGTFREVFQGIPCAAGRVTSLGDRSFSSSETTGRMLALAIKKTVKALEKNRISETKEKGR